MIYVEFWIMHEVKDNVIAIRGLNGGEAAGGLNGGDDRAVKFDEQEPPMPDPAGADASLDVDYDIDGYEMVRDGDDAGLYRLVERKEGHDRVWVSAPFQLLGRARDPHGGSWARWLSWNDGDGREHTHAIADTKLHGDPGALCAELAAGGLKIATKQHRDFVAYVNLIESKIRLTAVERTGWHEVDKKKVFVMPTRALGNVEGEKVVFLGDQHSPFQEKGTLADWRAGIATPIAGHDLPVFAVSASFAAPLAGLAGIEGGGFNFFGLSSTGKTTIIQAAASVYGRGDEHGFVATWRNTANAMEGTAVLHTDVPMVLDELGIAEPREVGAVIYQLATGIGKGRADKTGAARERKSWRTLIISTGELCITDKIVEGGCRAKAGQEVRVVDISADAGAGYGVFNDLGDGDAGALADSIKTAAITSYGTAGPAFIEAVIAEGTDKVVSIVKDAIASFVAEVSAPGASGQIERAARRFSLVAAAGELAIQFGIVPWPPGSASAAAATLFKSWVSARGGTGPAEIRNAIRQVKDLLGRYGDSRFDSASGVSDRPAQERWGWRWGEGEDREWGILPEVWRERFCSGFDANMVAKALDGRGVLRHPTGRLQGQMKINGVPHRLYLLSAQKLEALHDE
jgi:putative DNA primase/helicase